MHAHSLEGTLATRGGVEDTRLEAKAKDTKNPRPRTALPMTDPLEAKDRNAQGQEPRNLSRVLQKRKKGLQNFFSGDLQNFNNSKNTAVLEPRTGQFSRT